MQLPAATASCDVATIAFGIRNVADRMGALRELVRVARPGGRVIVLEFSMPPGALLGRLYRFYFTRLLPFIGRMRMTTAMDSDFALPPSSSAIGDGSALGG